MRDQKLSGGLEVWLTGTPAELTAAARALAEIGWVAYSSGRHPLTGADTGRWRVYARIAVPTESRQPAPRPSAVVEGQQELAA